jgi:ribosome-associated protein
MTELMALTDYFVITNGTNTRQVQAIADEIMKAMKKRGVRCLSTEGMAEATWVLLDYGDVVVHVFDRSTRAFYDLEHLWADAPRARWRASTARKRRKGDAE